MSKIRVGVLRGGPSSEYEVSLKTGAYVLKTLPEKYEPVDIFIDRTGLWHRHGIPTDPGRVLKSFDVVFNALHGEYGEDGKVQSILDSHNIPYTGSGTFSSVLAMNKVATKKALLRAGGVKTPHFTVLVKGETDEKKFHEVFRKMPLPLVVKPRSLGSSVGVSIVRSFSELISAVEKVFEKSDATLIEEYIQGKEATCGVIDGFRGSEFYTLPPIEIIPPADRKFFDYEAKYGGASSEICPGNFSGGEKEELSRLASYVHRTLGLRHYSRSDFIVHPRRGIYFLEVNTLPGLTSESLVPKALLAVGASGEQFLDHILSLVLGKS